MENNRSNKGQINMYSTKELARIKWTCRRGMKELDIMIMPFFEHVFPTLSEEEQQDFVNLLKVDDPDLFRFCMRQKIPEDVKLAQIVKKIIAYRNAQFARK